MTTSGKKLIKIYTLSTCPTCKWLKQKLTEMGHEYEAIDVDLLVGGEQWVVLKEVKKYNPEATFPTMIIEKVITAFSDEMLEKELSEQ